MNLFVRVAFIILTFFLSVFSLIFLLMMINNDILSQMIVLVTYLRDQRTYQIVAIVFWLVVLVLCLAGMVYSIMSGRLRRSRIRSTDIGSIDIGVDAIESIALNSAKTAQCGIKTAKAKVFPSKGDKINVQLNTVLYSDVEVPAMMAKVQDRIKKDIERYTGIPVARVQVRVSRVEPVSARVER
ncbi:MAG: alkaline shock response membrane anchor protein AmaP [Clostridiaceae bacterium]|nr:alkaline shock response membrane anchor protein AmaP [Eubacteriales bacterium]NLV48096.1 alkaline shock response membrane anchor protein AmaP [Clostridiaceae bacterium]